MEAGVIADGNNDGHVDLQDTDGFAQVIMGMVRPGPMHTDEHRLCQMSGPLGLVRL